MIVDDEHERKFSKRKLMHLERILNSFLFLVLRGGINFCGKLLASTSHLSIDSQRLTFWEERHIVAQFIFPFILIANPFIITKEKCFSFDSLHEKSKFFLRRLKKSKSCSVCFWIDERRLSTLNFAQTFKTLETFADLRLKKFVCFNCCFAWCKTRCLVCVSVLMKRYRTCYNLRLWFKRFRKSFPR